MPPLLPHTSTTNSAFAGLAAVLTVILGWVMLAQPARGDNGTLLAAIQQSRFIAYTPRGFSVVGGKTTPASLADIREDLIQLRTHFNGLITYSSANNIEAVATVANELGYRAVIVGIWDPFSETEIDNALTAFRNYPNLVIAVVIGNEGIYTKRYTTKNLHLVIARIKKRAPKLAVTTSEPFFLYFTPDCTDLFQSLDLQMPNVHPVFEPWFRPTEPDRGVTMVIQVSAKFAATYHQPLLIKETGIPSGGAPGYSPAAQATFWSELTRRFPASPVKAFAYFEAFDAPWKPAAMAAELPGDHAIESHWGFFTNSGRAKEVVTRLAPLTNLPPKK